MKRPIACLALALACLVPAAAPASAQSAETLSHQGYEALVKKDYARSADLLAAAIRAGATDPGTLYNAARANARLGHADAAFELLTRALEAGWSDVSAVEKEPDLESLRADPRWVPLVERFKTTTAARERFWNSPAISTPYRVELSEDERVAGLSRLWSEVKFDFANFDLVPDLDWDAVYTAYLPRVRQARSTLEYYYVLMEVAAKLHDGHTGVWVPAELVDEVYAKPALRTAVVEDRVVVSRLLDEALRVDGVEPGVEILEVEGMPVRKYGAERVAPYQSASTPQDLETRTYVYALLSGSASAPVEVTLRSASGEVFRRKLRRLSTEERAEMPQTPPMEFRMLPGNVAYVALNRFDIDDAAEQFEAKFAEIARADALVLDVRENGGGNSSVGYRVLACLTDRSFKGSRWRTRDYRPTYRAWGRAEGAYEEEAEVLEPNGKLLYTKPVVVLTSARTYSAAEDFTVAFDAMKRGTIVGEPTGGSTGQPLIFRLPGGGGARVCTKRDTYPDGKEFVGVGIQPQVLVRPRLDDLRTGRDTVLEAALAFLRQPRTPR